MNYIARAPVASSEALLCGALANEDPRKLTRAGASLRALLLPMDAAGVEVRLPKK